MTTTTKPKSGRKGKLLRKAFELTRPIVIRKTREAKSPSGKKNFKYFVDFDVQVEIDNVFNKTKFFYILHPFSAELWHEDVDEPLHAVEFGPDKFNHEEAEFYANSKSANQKGLEQVTYARKVLFMALLGLKCDDDVEANAMEAAERTQQTASTIAKGGDKGSDDLVKRMNNWKRKLKTKKCWEENTLEDILGHIAADGQFTPQMKTTLTNLAKRQSDEHLETGTKATINEKMPWEQ